MTVKTPDRSIRQPLMASSSSTMAHYQITTFTRRRMTTTARLSCYRITERSRDINHSSTYDWERERELKKPGNGRRRRGKKLSEVNKNISIYKKYKIRYYPGVFRLFFVTNCCDVPLLINNIYIIAISQPPPAFVVWYVSFNITNLCGYFSLLLSHHCS